MTTAFGRPEGIRTVPAAAGRSRRERRLLALDWNGTVVADAERACEAVREALREEDADTPADLDSFRYGWLLPLRDYFLGLGVRPARLAHVEQRWNDALRARTTRLAPGARELLDWCQGAGVPVVVLSGADESVVRGDAAHLGVGPLLTEVVGRAHPKSAHLARWRDEGRSVLYVGDTEYDVSEARTARVSVVAFAGGYRSAEQLGRENGRPGRGRPAPGDRCARDAWLRVAASEAVARAVHRPNTARSGLGSLHYRHS